MCINWQLLPMCGPCEICGVHVDMALYSFSYFNNTNKGVFWTQPAVKGQ